MRVRKKLSDMDKHTEPLQMAGRGGSELFPEILNRNSAQIFEKGQGCPMKDFLPLKGRGCSPTLPPPAIPVRLHRDML